jgi:copper chaperone CopZ
MKQKTYFHLNCNPLIPDCGYHCDKCIGEIRTVLKEKDGVSEVSLTKHKNISLIVVEYESEIIKVGDLKKELESLPSFYAGKFIPEVAGI